MMPALIKHWPDLLAVMQIASASLQSGSGSVVVQMEACWGILEAQKHLHKMPYTATATAQKTQGNVCAACKDDVPKPRKV
jgi:hypothetical protein